MYSADDAADAGTVAVDIGGSGVRAGRLVGGQLGPISESPLDATLDGSEIRRRIAAVLLAAGARPGASIGIGFPAFLDAAGRVRDALNLPGLDGMDLEATARELVGAGNVAIVPDSAAAALAEAVLGSGRGARRVLTVVVGTGCNAGMTVDGRVVALAGGSLGDAGHGAVTLRDVACWCGGRGCLEAFLSGAAFDLRAPGIGLRGRSELLTAAAGGHEAAGAVIREAGEALGAAIGAWSALLWPERVVIGGGVGLRCGEPLLAAARGELRRVGADHLTRGIELSFSSLGPSAPLLGAGLAAAGND